MLGLPVTWRHPREEAGPQWDPDGRRGGGGGSRSSSRPVPKARESLRLMTGLAQFTTGGRKQAQVSSHYTHFPGVSSCLYL